MKSTVTPSLRLMIGTGAFEHITLVTIERGPSRAHVGDLGIAGIHHVPFRPIGRGFSLLGKLDQLVRLPLMIRSLILRERSHCMIARTAPAGAFAYLAHRLTGLPFIVESFEPHADYMAGAGIWKRGGPQHRLSKWLERGQIARAAWLIPVTNGFAELLGREGVAPDRIKVVPCTTDLERFRYRAEDRVRIRERLGFQHAIIGVYLGKFGGLYYDDEAFQIFKEASDVIGERFRLLVLTPEPAEQVVARAVAAGIERPHMHVGSASHAEVPQWLSAADFGFATIKYSPHARYQSPVKTGEYWACGLPVALTDGIGDDHGIIAREPYAGALYNISETGSVRHALEHIRDLINAGPDRERIASLAARYRAMAIAQRAYREVFVESADRLTGAWAANDRSV